MDRKTAYDIVGPRQAVVVSCRGKVSLGALRREATELQPVTSHMLVSAEPFIYAIALDKASPAAEIIRESRVFAVNFINERHHPYLEHLHSHPLDTDKENISGLRVGECRLVEAPFIKDSSAVLECELSEALDYGNRTLIVAKVVGWEQISKENRILHDGSDYFVLRQ